MVKGIYLSVKTYIPFARDVYTFCAICIYLLRSPCPSRAFGSKGKSFLVYFFFFTKLSITFVGRMGIGAYV